MTSEKCSEKKQEVFFKKSLHFILGRGIIFKSQEVKYAPLAQLDRASGYGPEGRGFESLTACQKSSKSSDFEDFCFSLVPFFGTAFF